MVSTDTAGASEVTFAHTRALGYRWAPRLADLPDLRLWRTDRHAHYGQLDGGLRPSGQTYGDEGRDRVRRLCAAWDVGPWVARPAARIVNQEVIEMLILVAYASKHGATRGIAERSTKTGDGRARGSYATVACCCRG